MARAGADSGSMTNTDPVTTYLTAIENATIPACDGLAPDVILDATVPNWRYRVEGQRRRACRTGQVVRRRPRVFRGPDADPASLRRARPVHLPMGRRRRPLTTWTPRPACGSWLAPCAQPGRTASGSDPVKSAIDAVLAAGGWRPPGWYGVMKTVIEPVSGDPHRLAAAAGRAGLVDVSVARRAPDLGVRDPAGDCPLSTRHPAHFPLDRQCRPGGEEAAHG